ncbi:MAG: hypothetical protein Q9208_004659 [Pyrenodesmia sp. 3 TL-2023]
MSRKRAPLPGIGSGSADIPSHVPDIESDAESSTSGEETFQFDPQFDPWEEYESDELNPFSSQMATDVHPTAVEEPELDQHELPPLLRHLEDGTAQLPEESVKNVQRCQSQPHKRYSQFLHRLCSRTATARFEDDCLEGFPHLLSMICRLDLADSYEDQPDVDTFAYAAVIYLWLLVCGKRLQGTLPSDEEYLHVRWASYYLSSLEILSSDITDINTGKLDFAMKHWEDRGFAARQRSLWAHNGWFTALERDDPDKPCHRNDEAAEYLNVLRQEHIEGLTEFLVRREVECRKSAMKELPGVEPYKWCVAMMASIDPDLLKAIIEGQVEKKSRMSGSAVSNCLRRLASNSNPPPSIYQNAICDREGISPTPFQWRKICHLMQVYVSDNENGNQLAMRVDQLIYPVERWPVPTTPRQARFRRYTEGNHDGLENCTSICGNRRTTVWEFTEQMAKRLDTDSEEGREHVPLAAPVVQMGFSNSVVSRLSNHRRHEGSNYLMNLAEALFQYEYPGRFCLMQHILFSCWRKDQPWPSEILFTRLAQAYTTNGGGFSHWGAGFSNGVSWRKRPAEDWTRFEYQMSLDDAWRARLEDVGRRAAIRAEEDARERERAREAEARYLEFLRAFGDVVDAAREVVQALREE